VLRGVRHAEIITQAARSGSPSPPFLSRPAAVLDQPMLDGQMSGRTAPARWAFLAVRQCRGPFRRAASAGRGRPLRAAPPSWGSAGMRCRCPPRPAGLSLRWRRRSRDRQSPARPPQAAAADYAGRRCRHDRFLAADVAARRLLADHGFRIGDPGLRSGRQRMKDHDVQHGALPAGPTSCRSCRRSVARGPSGPYRQHPP
jgi:hypothetical protein